LTLEKLDRVQGWLTVLSAVLFLWVVYRRRA
jgi:hypothetical protein